MKYRKYPRLIYSVNDGWLEHVFSHMDLTMNPNYNTTLLFGIDFCLNTTYSGSFLLPTNIVSITRLPDYLQLLLIITGTLFSFLFTITLSKLSKMLEFFNSIANLSHLILFLPQLDYVTLEQHYFLIGFLQMLNYVLCNYLAFPSDLLFDKYRTECHCIMQN